MFSKSLRTFCGAFAIATMGVGSSAAFAETLADSLAKAYRNNGFIEQNRAILRAADEDVAQAIATLRPVISWLGQFDYVDNLFGESASGFVGLRASWLLSDFGQSQLGIEATKETVLATRQALLDVENGVLLSTVAAYLDVRRSEVFIELRENNVGLLTEQLRATQDRFEVGEVTRTDVSLAESRLASARSGLAVARGDLARAREEFKAVVGEYPGELGNPSVPRLPASEQIGRDLAQRENPLIRQVQHQVRAAELRVEQARMARRPVLSGLAGLDLDEEFDRVANIGLRLTGTIYQGGAISSRLRQVQALRDQVRALLFTTGLEVDQGVGNAYADFAVAVASIAASEQEVAAAELTLEGVREEFQLGARTTLDVLDREQELLDARTFRVIAEVDRILAGYRIIAAIGQLTAEKLQLDVPIYDPAAYYNAVKDAPLQAPSAQGQQLDRVLKSIGKE